MNRKKKQKQGLDKDTYDESKQAKNNFNEGKAIFQMALCNEEIRQALELFNKAILKSTPVQPLHFYIYYYRGLCYYRLKQYDNAEIDLQQSISIPDDKTKGLFFNALGKCKIQMAQNDEAYLDKAAKCFQKSLEYSNNLDGQAYYYLGLIYKKVKKNIQAIKQFTNGLKHLKHNDQFQSYVERGLCYRQIGQIDNSIEDLIKAADIKKDSPLAQFHLGVNYLLNFKYDNALDKFDAAIQTDKHQPRYYNYKGLTLYLIGQYQPCLTVFKQALKLYSIKATSTSQVGQCWFNTGNALLNLNKQDQALKAFQKAEEFSDNQQLRLKIYYAQGRAYEVKGDIRSIRKFQHCLEIIGQNKNNQLYLSGLYHLGINQLKNKFTQQAINSFTMILQSDCNDKCVFEVLGKAYMQNEQYQLALKNFEALASFDENYPEVYYLKGLAKNQLGDLYSAINDFYYSVELGSKNIAIFNGISTSYFMAGRFEKSLVYSNIALQKQPNNQQFLIQRSRIYLELKQNAKGIDDLSKALKVNKNNPITYYRRGLALYKNKQYQNAIQDLLKALECKPSRFIESDIHYHLGIAFANLDRYQQSIEPLSRAILIQNQPKYYHERSKAYMLLDENTNALNDLNQVIKNQPENAFAYFRRGLTQKALKKYEQAAQDFLKSRQISPNDPRLIINKKQIYYIKYRKLCDPGQQQ